MLDRRAFLQSLGAGTLAYLCPRLPVRADALDHPNFDPHLPADKGLKADWVQSLFLRGTPELYAKDQLQNVRMPISGICTGQELNLSGDGSLVGWRVHATPLDIAQGFTLRTTSAGNTQTHPLGRDHFPDLTFRGEYPIAKVEYAHAAIPVQVSLEAFSPYCPLNFEDSGLPATIFNFTLKNTSPSPVEATLAGSWENGVCAFSRANIDGMRRNKIVRGPNLTVVDYTADPIPVNVDAGSRPDLTFEDWSAPTFAKWTVEGTAFGPGPVDRTKIEDQPGRMGGKDARLASSFLASQSDAALGKLTSSPFTIDRRYVNFWLAAPNQRDKILVNLLVDGQVVKTRTGIDVSRFFPYYFDLSPWSGRQGTLQFVDASADHDGRLTIGRIFFSDVSGDGPPLAEFPDYGSMALALVGAPPEVALAQGDLRLNGTPADEASAPLADSLIGTLGRTVPLQPGDSAIVTFILAEFFPNLEIRQLGKQLRYYTTKFTSAHDVAEHVAGNLQKLTDTTRLWRDTWYDSTLPYWFLDRTFANASTVASDTCYRIATGRFYAYEGAPAPNFEGTCTHVWSYAHSMARTFPALERDTRERVDLGVALDLPTGVMDFRGEAGKNGLAVDGQLGTIMRFYREHQMSPDDSWLRRNWDKIKLTFNPLFALDPDEDGILEGRQNNTLDCGWYGQIPWMSSMYLGALRAGEAMAREMGDGAFADRCAKIAQAGLQNIPARLFNGEYFFNIIDPKNAEWINSGDGCHLDQVFGQGWAFQIGVPRVLPEKETRAALASIWKYNFAPDANAYFQAHPVGRGFVDPGDAGLIMTTFPRTDWDFNRAQGTQPYGRSFAGYFNETWTGQEYQLAGHMFWEGMIEEGMVIVRAIHDRYDGRRRNPWAEEEAGIHYSRAMASHGAFIGLCGYEYHGPRGHLGFAPKLTPENFRAPFTAAEGWGTFAQTITPAGLQATLEIKWGQLRLQTLDLTPAAGTTPTTARASLAGTDLPLTFALQDGRAKLAFPNALTLRPNAPLTIHLT